MTTDDGSQETPHRSAVKLVECAGTRRETHCRGGRQSLDGNELLPARRASQGPRRDLGGYAPSLLLIGGSQSALRFSATEVPHQTVANAFGLSASFAQGLRLSLHHDRGRNHWVRLSRDIIPTSHSSLRKENATLQSSFLRNKVESEFFWRCFGLQSVVKEELPRREEITQGACHDDDRLLGYSLSSAVRFLRLCFA